MRVLLIDDERVGLKVRRLLLESQGHEVMDADTATRGVALMAAEDFDLAVLDYQLPDMTGAELVQRMTELKPSVPLILLSGQFDVCPEVQALVSDFIVKGSGAAQLLQSVERHGKK